MTHWIWGVWGVGLRFVLWEVVDWVWDPEWGLWSWSIGARGHSKCVLCVCVCVCMCVYVCVLWWRVQSSISCPSGAMLLHDLLNTISDMMKKSRGQAVASLLKQRDPQWLSAVGNADVVQYLRHLDGQWPEALGNYVKVCTLLRAKVCGSGEHRMH